MKVKKQNKRQSVNSVSFLVTCLFLVLAVQFSNGGGLFATKINLITENLDKAVMGLNDNVSYTNYTDNSQYSSSTEFRPVGMAGLYNLTNLFIDLISPKDILMPDLVTYDGHNFNYNLPEISAVVKYYASLVGIVLFLVLCVVLFPFCGLCFCCCRCCGNCGATPKASDKKRDTCKKVIQASLLIVCGTALLFCIVCAFGSNQQLQEGIESFPENVKNSIKDTKTFLNSTNGQVRYLLRNNYDEFTDAFTDVMKNASKIALDQLLTYANATSVSEIYTFADNLVNINSTLYSLKVDTNRLRVYASQLNDAVRKVRRDLTTTLNGCLVDKCAEVKRKVDTLQTSIDFNSVPDVSETIERFSKLDVAKINTDVQNGRKSLENIQNQINSSLSNGLEEAKNQIKNAGSVIDQNLKSITDTVDQVKSQIDKTASPAVNQTQDYINDHGKYRYYVGLTFSCMLLLVAVFITFGLVCGICGKRPDGYSDNCCNKGAGSQFLLCAVWIMFFSGFIISIFTIGSLLVGVISKKAICDPFRNPNSTEYGVIKLVDKLDLGVDIKPSTMLTNCYQNKSIYETFNLESKFNIADIKAKFNISEELNKLNINTVDIQNFSLMANSTLDDLEKISPDINVDKFRDELMKNFTNYNLNELADGLKNLISQLNQAQEQQLRSSLELSLLHLTTYDEKLVTPMKKLAQQILDDAEGLNEQFKMSHTNFSEAIRALRDEITQAENALRNEGPTKLSETADYFKNITLKIINGYIDRVSDQIQGEIGQCGPLSLVINATLTSTCEKVLLPWNGFWFSLFCALILYVLTIFVAVRLANLYQKHKPYDQYVETRGAKRGKKKGKKTKRSEERPIGREVARDYAAVSHPPDGRYADMAPKSHKQDPNANFLRPTRY